MSSLLRHLPVLPIVVPLLAAASMLMLSEARRAARVAIAIGSMLVQLSVALVLLYLTSDAAPEIWPDGIGVYAIGSWQAPFGIVLVVDRLSAVMVALTAAVGLTTVTYSVAHWDRPGQPFHSLLQLLAMGLNGAFLTGDLFNLFVFFEVLLAASYGLVLRGPGSTRVKASLHYIAVNLLASVLFLIGVALIYGIAGTLNMADLAGRIALLSPDDRALFDAGAALLGIAFLIKAGSWPLNFWLPDTYSAAIAPSAAAFALMTKVGVYAILRVGTLLSGDPTTASMIGAALYYIGLATLLAGAIGMLSAQSMPRLVSFSVIVSTGTLLAALGLGMEKLTAPILYYLMISVLTTCAFFMLAGMTDRTRESFSKEAEPPPPEPPTPLYQAFGVREPDPYSLDEEVGIAIPGAMVFMGLVFVCCVLLVTGLPPLPGFVAKFSLLSTAIDAEAGGGSARSWVLSVAVLLAGFCAIVALTRMGMRLFWSIAARTTPRLRVLEAAPVAVLVLACIVTGAAAGQVMHYLEDTAHSLHAPRTYVQSVIWPDEDEEEEQP